MRKVNNFLAINAITLMLLSCATSKEARSYKKIIDGNWQLQSIVTTGITGKVKVELFNEEDYNCFIGSNWNFNQNNSLGFYNISKNGNECADVKRNIRWTIYEANNEPKLLQFKRLDNKLNVMDNGDGFRFTIAQLDNNTMQLKSNITFENKPAWLVYNYIKN